MFGLNEKGEFENKKCIDIMLRVIAYRNEKMKDRVLDRWLNNRGKKSQEMF